MQCALRDKTTVGALTAARARRAAYRARRRLEVRGVHGSRHSLLGRELDCTVA